MSKKFDSIQESKKQFEEYFNEDLEAIEEELKKSKEYSKIIDDEIKKLSAPTLGSNKGAQHYLIEHITNAVQLQTQRQGLRKDRFTIKKAIMDYASKFADGTGENTEDITTLVKKIIDSGSNNLNYVLKDDVLNDNSDIDSEIDNILGE